jgi:hypothetical protein
LTMTFWTENTLILQFRTKFIRLRLRTLAGVIF